MRIALGLSTLLGVGLLVSEELIRLHAQAQVLSSVWYRGQPPGVPQQSDLDAIRAAGFGAVTWPLQHTAHALDVQRMAASAGLTVVVRSEPVPLKFGDIKDLQARVDIAVAKTPQAQWTALIWRALAYGARVISFDGGAPEGSALSDANGSSAWSSVASAVARQATTNGGLIASLTRGPAVTVDPPDPDLDVSLLENRRSWVVIATNATGDPGRVIDTYATFPAPVPAALWLNLIDGEMMSMLHRPAGPRWHVRLGPGDAKVYVIDKR